MNWIKTRFFSGEVQFIVLELYANFCSFIMNEVALLSVQVRNNMVDKRRWSSVRSYLCGDEFNSVLAEEDSASVKSSEATVTQPIPDELTDEGDLQSKEAKKQQKQNSASNFFSEEEAAIVIQSAFRGFLVNPHSQNTQFTSIFVDRYLPRK